MSVIDDLAHCKTEPPPPPGGGSSMPPDDGYRERTSVNTPEYVLAQAYRENTAALEALSKTLALLVSDVTVIKSDVARIKLDQHTLKSVVSAAFIRGEAELGSCEGRSVLIVEDNNTLRSVITREFKRAGADCYTAHGVQDCIEQLRTMRNVPLDGAYVDVLLGDGNGIELARLIRQQHPETRIVLTSGEGAESLQSTAASLGGQALGKPCGFGELVTALLPFDPGSRDSRLRARLAQQ